MGLTEWGGFVMLISDFIRHALKICDNHALL